MRPHISINVANLEKSVEFYRNVFGLEPQKKSATYAKFDLKQPALNFAMHEAIEGRKASQVNHLGIEVESAEEVAGWQKMLSGQGVATLIEENTDCCFARQDKFWFQDPDGNSWEVFFVHEQLPVVGAEPPTIVPKASACSTASKCC
jgi:catechol 2,3-dioxygenase-like lactoylglutathione lyase family enzyme